MKAEELGEAYRQFFKTNLGKDLLQRVSNLYVAQINGAVQATSKEDSWSLMRRANGINIVLSEFKRLQTVDKKGVGRK